MVSLRPRLQALLLAEHLYIDGPTGKRVVAGTFNTLHVAHFPAQTLQLCVAYISLTDVRGPVRLALRLIDNQDLSVVMESDTLEITAQTPQETIEIGIPVPGFFLPHAGVYDFELHADEQRLGCLRLIASKIEQNQDERDDTD